MALYHAIGSALATMDEVQYREKLLQKFHAGETDEVEFIYGKVSRNDQNQALVGDDEEDGTTPFTEIGIGKPLLAQIRHVYRGKYPKGRNSKNKEMLVTSAMKSVSQFNAQPRAINFLTGEIKSRKGFSYVSATDQGTPIIYYSPALTVGESVITIEVGFNNFDSRFLNEIGGFLQSAGSIPAFLAHSTHLVGAGFVAKLIGKIGERFREKGPDFDETEPVNFTTAGTHVSLAGFKVITPGDFPSSLLKDFKVNARGELHSESGEIYDGSIPYVTISLDGAEREDLNSFEQTQASAALLADYFAIREGNQLNLDVVLEGLQLYSDLKFRDKADSIKEKMEEIGEPEDPEYKKLKEKYDALIKNIQEEKLKP